jgi:hypothetical protein
MEALWRVTGPAAGVVKLQHLGMPPLEKSFNTSFIPINGRFCQKSFVFALLTSASFDNFKSKIYNLSQKN